MKQLLFRVKVLFFFSICFITSYSQGIKIVPADIDADFNSNNFTNVVFNGKLYLFYKSGAGTCAAFDGEKFTPIQSPGYVHIPIVYNGKLYAGCGEHFCVLNGNTFETVAGISDLSERIKPYIHNNKLYLVDGGNLVEFDGNTVTRFEGAKCAGGLIGCGPKLFFTNKPEVNPSVSVLKNGIISSAGGPAGKGLRTSSAVAFNNRLYLVTSTLPGATGTSIVVDDAGGLSPFVSPEGGDFDDPFVFNGKLYCRYTNNRGITWKIVAIDDGRINIIPNPDVEGRISGKGMEFNNKLYVNYLFSGEFSLAEFDGSNIKLLFQSKRGVLFIPFAVFDNKLFFWYPDDNRGTGAFNLCSYDGEKIKKYSAGSDYYGANGGTGAVVFNNRLYFNLGRKGRLAYVSAEGEKAEAVKKDASKVDISAWQQFSNEFCAIRYPTDWMLKTAFGGGAITLTPRIDDLSYCSLSIGFQEVGAIGGGLNMLNSLSQTFSSPNAYDTQRKKFKGHDELIVIHKALPLYSVSYIFAVGSRIYNAVFSVKRGMEDAYKPIIQEMLNSIDFK